MATSTGKFSLEEVNKMKSDEFIRIFGEIVEHSPLLMAAVSIKRPFHSIRDFHASIVDVISRLPSDVKEGVLLMYPDLGSKLEGLSDSSQNEHKISGLVSLPALQINLLRRLNQTYRSQNNFPFILCMKENKASDVLSHMEAGLTKHRNAAMEIGLGEVCKIAWYRLIDLCENDESVSIGPAVHDIKL